MDHHRRVCRIVVVTESSQWAFPGDKIPAVPKYCLTGISGYFLISPNAPVYLKLVDMA